MERPGFQTQPYLLQTSSEHVWEPVDLNFSYEVASPKLPSHSGILPLHSEMCVWSLPVPQPLRRWEGFPAPPLPEKEGGVGGRELAVGFSHPPQPGCLCPSVLTP